MKISMKKLIYLLAFMTLAFASCDKDDPSKPDKPPQPPPDPPDTTWFSMKTELSVVYQHDRWDVTACYIFFAKEEDGGTVFEEYVLEWQHKLSYVEKEWRYQKDEARKHIGKKRYVFVKIFFGIPGTIQGGSDEKWIEVEIQEGENLVEAELMTPI
jgi:hypothetical protein